MNRLKMLKLFLKYFFFTLVLYFIFYLVKFDDFISKEVFSSVQQAFNMSIIWSFMNLAGKIRQDNPIEDFIKDRKNLIIFTLLYVWIFTLVIELSKDWLITKHIHVLNSIIYNLIWAVIATLLAILFSGAFSKK